MTRTIRFIPIKHGDEIDLGDLGLFGISGSSKYLGFKPAAGRKLAGWMVVALGEPNGQPHKRRTKEANRGRKGK